MVDRKLEPKLFFTQKEQERIVQAIRKAESKTSGEIRVYLEKQAGREIFNRAKRIFGRLGMTQTKQRNGVLIYFSLKDHRFAVLGDQDIHDKVGADFWTKVVSTLAASFSHGGFVEGLEAGIDQLGEELQKYFPRQRGDINELPDEIPK